MMTAARSTTHTSCLAALLARLIWLVPSIWEMTTLPPEASAVKR